MRLRFILSLAAACTLCAVASAQHQPVAPPVIALVGDSTVASYDQPPADRPDLTGWGQVFQEYFVEGVRVVNLARSGASSKSFRSLGLWQRALESGASFVFIQFGHNDQPGKGDRSTDPEGEFRDNLRRFIAEAQSRNIHPVLVTPVARRTFQDGRIVSSLHPYVSAVLAVGGERKTPVVDLHRSSLALFGRLGDEGSAGFSAAPSDRSHWSRRGARAVASLVADAIPAGVPALRPFLRPRPRLTLPPVIYGVAGQESALYDYPPVLSETPSTYRLRVTGRLGRSDAGRWSVIPGEGDAGNHPLKVEALDAEGRALEETTMSFQVSPSSAGAGKTLSLLLVGDSLTHGSLYPNELARLLSRPGNPAWRMLGTHRPGGAQPGVQHEGYGGWTWANFVRKFAPSDFAEGRRQRSPFVFAGPDGTPSLDVARYFDEACGGARPTHISIMLGINDCFGLPPDNPAAIEAGIDRVFGEAELLLAALRRAAPLAEIGVCLTPPANERDIAFRANYQERYTRWGWKRIQHRLLQRQLEQFGAREHERIFLVPTGFGLDPGSGYPDNNAVHPNAAGYRQVAAEIYAWLKSRALHVP